MTRPRTMPAPRPTSSGLRWRWCCSSTPCCRVARSSSWRRVDFWVVPQDDGSFFFATTGMSAPGLMEIEGSARKTKPEDALGLLFNIAHYLCHRGPVLRDGDTFGLTPTEKHRVRHGPSAWEPRGHVLQLELERWRLSRDKLTIHH